jgi:hypothetical protein
MKNILLVFGAILIACSATAADGDPTQVAVKWNAKPALQTVASNALNLTLLDKNGAIVKAKRNLKVSSVRGGATVFLPADGTEKASSEIVATTNSDGEALIGVKMGQKSAVEINVVLLDNAGNPTDVTAEADTEGMIARQPPDKALGCENGCSDERSALEGSVYLGEVVDTFAADEVLHYLNPEDANKSTLRAIAGADFSYRLVGTQASLNQLWVYGETIHGVRSRDVNCSDPNNVKLSVCSNHLDEIMAKPDEQFIGIIRGASSLEAFVGLRYEFPPPLQALTDSPARIYVNAQAGFLTVAGGGGDVVDLHHIGVGARAVGGRFEGSFLEVGVGRNDLFHRRRTRRTMIDGFLSIDPHYIPLAAFGAKQSGGRVIPFIEFTGDFDLGRGSDSIQTWFGVDFHFK